MKEIKQNSTAHPILFLLVEATDHITPREGAAPTVTISKDGGAFAAAAGAVTEVGNGWYALAGNATDRNTLGTLLIHITEASSDPADDRYVVVPWDPYDANLGLTNLDAAVSSRSSYDGSDTSGVTTLLARLTSGRATDLDRLANLDATISSRSTYTGDDTAGTSTLLARLTAGRASNLDLLDAAISTVIIAAETDTPGVLQLLTRLSAIRATHLDYLTNLDAPVSSRSTFSGGAVASVTNPVTVGTNNDKTNYSLTSDYGTLFVPSTYSPPPSLTLQQGKDYWNP